MRMWSTRLRNISKSTCRGSALCTGPRRILTCTDQNQAQMSLLPPRSHWRGLPVHSSLYVLASLDSEVVSFHFVFMSKHLHCCPRISPGFVKRTESPKITDFQVARLSVTTQRGATETNVSNDCLILSFLMFFFFLVLKCSWDNHLFFLLFKYFQALNKDYLIRKWTLVLFKNESVTDQSRCSLPSPLPLVLLLTGLLRVQALAVQTLLTFP